MNRGRLVVLAGMFAFGLLLGMLTFGGLLTLYPPARGDTWKVLVVGLGSLLLVAGLYGVLVRVGGVGSGEWLVFGYVLGLVAFAMLPIVGEISTKFRRDAAAWLGAGV